MYPTPNSPHKPTCTTHPTLHLSSSLRDDLNQESDVYIFRAFSRCLSICVYLSIYLIYTYSICLCGFTHVNCFPDGLVVKNPPAIQGMQETWVQSPGQEDPLEEEMAHHSSILAQKIPWIEEPGGIQSKGSQKINATKHACMSVHMYMYFVPFILHIFKYSQYTYPHYQKLNYSF